MITGSGGAVPSSSVRRPATEVGCGIEGCWPWFVFVLVGVLEGVPRFVVVVLVVPVFPVPVGVVGVPVPPLFWPYAGTRSSPSAAAARPLVFTQTFGVIPPPKILPQLSHHFGAAFVKRAPFRLHARDV